MSAAKPSPLPWRAVPGFFPMEVDITAADGTYVGTLRRPFVNRAYVLNAQAVMQANAEKLERAIEAVDAVEDLVDALMRVLPIVEDAQRDPLYKPGYVADRIKAIHAALAKAGAIAPTPRTPKRDLPPILQKQAG